MESLLLYLWALFNCLFGLPQVHQKPPTSPPLLQGIIPPPPAPEPITVIELPLPPVAPDNREGSCSSEVNPARTGCIGRTTQIQSGNFLPDNLHVLSMVHFVGAPAAPDPASIFQGEQLIIIKIDGTLFPNGDSWRCITCGVPDHNAVGATPKLDYPQAFRDGRRILAGANIIQAAHGFTGDDLTPDQVHIIPIRWKTTADNSGPGGSMRELRLHPDDVHLGWSAFSFDTGSLGQYCYYGRLAFSPSPSSGLPLAPGYDLTSVNLLYDPVASQPLAVHPTTPRACSSTPPPYP
ncbi:saponin hydrolase [Verticillium alfalfae VaMs.102]|uniref:Saponin hydrolase n=1 Tax=Verticillium alfalfae (strain VaMs.102 / ATCC MYA-4576 / FGSC 10136) TaxID=526221 RepID=C9SEY2_VERA1|nr:saponin hydrolase [Verticillium alfalfae VaMs.102]EEY17768.1 saponin hydrolase [Verticillium alfalfae VaMs.102]